MGREDRLERLPGALEPLFTQVVDAPWYEREPDAPEYMELSHDKFKAHLSRDVKPGGSGIPIYIQPPGKEVGGRDCSAIEATYVILDGPGTSGGLVGRVDAVKVRNYMVTSRKYKAEVLQGDTLELWPTSKLDHFVMGLIKEVCWVCGKETGDAGNGLAYICEGCDKSVHAKCAGLRKNLREDEDFFCRRCRPTVAEDTIGEDTDEKEAAVGGSVAAEEGSAAAADATPAGRNEEGAGRGTAAGKGGKPAGKAKVKGKDEGTKGEGSAKRKAGKGVEGDVAKAKAKKSKKGADKAAVGVTVDGGAAGSSKAK